MLFLYGYLCHVIYKYQNVFMPHGQIFNAHQGVHATSNLRPRGIFLLWVSCPIICLAKCRSCSFLQQRARVPLSTKQILWVNMPFSNMGFKAKFSLGIFQKNCSSGVSQLIVRCLLIMISSSKWAPDYPTGAWTCFFFKHEHTLYISFLSCVDHTWYGFWVL